MNFYVSIFKPSGMHLIHRYGPDAATLEGGVMHAMFSLKGQTFMCIDSIVAHDFAFTPAISLYVACDSAEEIEHLFAKLSEGGTILMPLSSTPVSEKFGWVSDRSGVSWQLNLAKK